jgi:hypothetical protein
LKGQYGIQKNNSFINSWNTFMPITNKEPNPSNGLINQISSLIKRLIH